ncbi:hypothetical protein ACRRRS_21090 [Brucella anthropi]|uniref:Uncharacterized protein n=2 Tax=Brucella lupini TaxID=255457 RepID=A0A256GHK5_9HYPH|nr:hypothetical protein [Brucella anthropi]OYR26366.1 hypothetical protein CES86_3834 [Brucella lupini]
MAEISIGLMAKEATCLPNFLNHPSTVGVFHSSKSLLSASPKAFLERAWSFFWLASCASSLLSSSKAETTLNEINRIA